MEAGWGVDDTTATAVECAVRPSGEASATGKVRLGCVLAAAGLAVEAGCLGAGGTEGLGLYGWPRPWVGLNREWRSGKFRGWDDLGLDGKPFWRPKAPGLPGQMMVCWWGFGLLRRSPGGGSEVGTHGVPIRPWGLNRLRDVEVEAEGLRTPKIHCDPSTVFAKHLRTGTGHVLVYDAPKREGGIQGLGLPISLMPTQLAARGQCATITLEEAPRRVRPYDL